MMSIPPQAKCSRRGISEGDHAQHVAPPDAEYLRVSLRYPGSAGELVEVRSIEKDLHESRMV